ncbi:MAG: ATP-binding cassette domain-containing protein [Spirochaetia bacterium]|jgi:D-methionine transport system ATP-binding protein|nr:ATP-binding cassette domain-containing protein [Spirochaetia bacterium]
MFHAQRPEEAAFHRPLKPRHAPSIPTRSVLNSEAGAEATAAEAPAISLRSLTKRFGSHEILRDVSLSVLSGTIFGIIGRSGAGKTTLIRIASLLEKADFGEVFYGGASVSGARGQALLDARRKAGFVFQNFNLFASRTVFGNVAFPLEAAGWAKPGIEERVQELLELVGLADKADRPANRLSGGERQRVAIARALANNPKILFCDEATSALDPETTRSILDLIQSLSRRFGLTVLMVTHQMEVVRRICDQVAILSAGSIVERGPVASVFANPRSETGRRIVGEVSHG